MSKLSSKIYYIILFSWSLLMIMSIYFSLRKTTYVENAKYYATYSDIITISEPQSEITEQIIFPYDLIRSISVCINNNDTDVNSRWEFTLKDPTGKILMQKKFNFTNAENNQFYKIDFGKIIHVSKDKDYLLTLRPLVINEENSLSFHIDTIGNSLSQDSALYVNNLEIGKTLCMIVQGYDIDLFWTGIVCIIGGVILFCLLRICSITLKGKKWWEDKLVISAMLGLTMFFLYLPYVRPEVGLTLPDENDNIQGGFLIAHGSILYKDYVVQHTPVAYYLCALYALLGASSIEQMRILFYLSIGLAWALIYLRYHDLINKRNMIILPLFIALISKFLIGSTATMIMSDAIQALALVLLLLELSLYITDKKIGLSRSIIVSVGIWFSFGSAFISLYSIAFIFIIFLYNEIIWWKQNGCHIKSMFNRYGLLFLCLITPPILVIIYFGANNALYEFYKQAYLFNREVYPNYQNMGSNLISPFFTGVQAMLCDFSNSLSNILQGNGSLEQLVYILLICLYLLHVLKNILHKPHTSFKWLLLTLLICSGATRGYIINDTHGLAFIAMLITVLILDNSSRQVPENIPQYKLTVIAITIGIVITPYISACVNNLTIEQSTVSLDDSYLLSETEPGEKIFINSFGYDTLYLLTHDRSLANRAAYILPWYMDWYEEWEIEDLVNEQPRFAIWNPDMEIWGYSHFCNEMDSYIKEHYSRISETSNIWVKED